jgi:pantothenate kinase
MGHSEDDARYIKAGLYQQIKDKFPNLSNMQRAIKLKEMANAEEVKKIVVHLPKLKELVTKAREQRSKERESSEKSAKAPKKTKASKESKEPKASKEAKPKKESKKASRTKRTSKY